MQKRDVPGLKEGYQGLAILFVLVGVFAAGFFVKYFFMYYLPEVLHFELPSVVSGMLEAFITVILLGWLYRFARDLTKFRFEDEPGIAHLRSPKNNTQVFSWR